jgi:hypothetical protein
MEKIKLLLSLIAVGITFSCSKDSDIINTPTSDKYYKDKEVEIIFENDRENGINVIFMGDAYLKADLIKNNGKYNHDAIKSIEFFFNSHPFFEYKNYFNAYIIYAESSILNTGNGFTANYPFGSTTAISFFPHPIITNYSALNDYVFKIKGRSITNKDLILMSVNGQTGGSAYLGGNIAVFGAFGSITTTAFPTTVFSTMLHEVGHAFASLGDEYIVPNQNSTYVPEGKANLDNTNNVNLIKWNHFFGLQGYSSVGAFEGGGYLEFGMWRPEENSIMRGSGSYFNAPSREAIVKRIMSLREIEYNFNSFLIKDFGNQSNKHSINAKSDKNERINCGGVR